MDAKHAMGIEKLVLTQDESKTITFSSDRIAGQITTIITYPIKNEKEVLDF